MFPGCSVAQVQGCVPKTTNESKGERTCESHCWPWETQRWASRASCINRIIYCSHRDTLLFSQDQRKCIKYWIRVCTGIAYCWFSPSMVITKCVNPKTTSQICTSWYGIVDFNTLVFALVFWRKADTRGRCKDLQRYDWSLGPPWISRYKDVGV